MQLEVAPPIHVAVKYTPSIYVDKTSACACMQHAITLTLAKRGGTPRSWQKRYNKYAASRRVNGAVYAEQKYYGRINPPMDKIRSSTLDLGQYVVYTYECGNHGRVACCRTKLNVYTPSQSAQVSTNSRATGYQAKASQNEQREDQGGQDRQATGPA